MIPAIFGSSSDSGRTTDDSSNKRFWPTNAVLQNPQALIAIITPPAVMCLMILLFHWGLVVGVGVIPYDATSDFYPITRLAAEQAREGHLLDLWNPWIVGGTPQLGLSLLQYDPFYWIAAAVPGDFTEHRFDMIVVLHLMSGALATYFLARSMSVPAWAGALAGLVFTLGGRSVSLLQHTGSVPELMSWFAWSALFLRLAIISRPGFPLAFAAAVAAAFGLSRFPAEIPNYMLGVLAIGGALPVVGQRSLLLRAAWHSSVWVGLSLALLAGSISVMGVVGTGSTSGVIDIWRGGLNAVPAMNLATAFIPGAVGNTNPDAFIGAGDITETWLYWGLLALLLAVYATVRTRSPETIWLGVVAIAGLGLALGMVTPLYSALFLVAPPVRFLLRAEPYLIIYALAIALLAGRGAGMLAVDLQEQAPLRRWLAGGLALLGGLLIVASMAAAVSAQSPLARLISEDAAVAALLALVLAGAVATYTVVWQGRHVLMFVLLIVVFFDLWHAGAFRHFSFSAGDGLAAPDALGGDRQAVAALREVSAGLAPYEFRIEPVANGAGWEDGSLVAGFQTLGGSISVDPTRLTAVLGKRDRRIATGLPEFSGAVKSYSSPLFDLFNVKYVISPIDVDTVDPEFQRDGFKLVHEGFRKIYENEDALPRARLTEAIAVPDMERALELLSSGTVDLRTTTIVEGIPVSISSSEPGREAQVVIESYDMSRVRLQVDAPGEGVLVLADNYAPGWKASIDGESTSVLPANVVHRAVVVPPGSHTVEMWYLPDVVNRARLLSAAALVAGLAFSAVSLVSVVLGRRRRLN